SACRNWSGNTSRKADHWKTCCSHGTRCRRNRDRHNEQGGATVPELPEVETVVREVRPRLVKRQLLKVRRGDLKLRRHWAPEWAAALAGRRVQRVERRGKWICIGLGGGMSLVVHLGMTGQLTVTPADAPLPPHTHLVI